MALFVSFGACIISIRSAFCLGAVTWLNEQDIAPETLLAEMVPMESSSPIRTIGTDEGRVLFVIDAFHCVQCIELVPNLETGNQQNHTDSYQVSELVE